MVFSWDLKVVLLLIAIRESEVIFFAFLLFFLFHHIIILIRAVVFVLEHRCIYFRHYISNSWRPALIFFIERWVRLIFPRTLFILVAIVTVCCYMLRSGLTTILFIYNFLDRLYLLIIVD